jgi:hypothetical protein
MERDERVTFERLKRLRRELVEPTLASHSGRLVSLSGAGTGVVGRVAMGDDPLVLPRALRGAEPFAHLRGGEPDLALIVPACERVGEAFGRNR